MKNNTLVFLGFMFICLINISAKRPGVQPAAAIVEAPRKVAPDSADARSASRAEPERLTERADRNPNAGPALR